MFLPEEKQSHCEKEAGPQPKGDGGTVLVVAIAGSEVLMFLSPSSARSFPAEHFDHTAQSRLCLLHHGLKSGVPYELEHDSDRRWKR